MSLTLIFGCMFGGKSSELTSLLNNDVALGLNVVYVTHSNDNRPYLTHCQTKKLHSKITTFHTHSLSDVVIPGLTPENARSHVIGVDEAQFFDVGMVDAIVAWKDMGCAVYVAGLVGKFDRTSFGYMHLLMQHGDDFIHKTSSCRVCIKEGKGKVKAIHTAKKPNVQVNEKGEAVGGDESYFPVCNTCYLSLNKE